MTNHHVGTDCIQKIGTKEHDYIKIGFYARAQTEETKCPDLELNVLMSIEDVTTRVNSAVRSDADPATAEKAHFAIGGLCAPHTIGSGCARLIDAYRCSENSSFPSG
jgi:hypothetical protein